jgi:hypothetical protein
MIMKNKPFEDIVKEHFRYLQEDYGFRLTKSKKEDSGYVLVYLSSTTGVKITYEFREAYVFIMLYRLIDGHMVEDTGTIHEDSILHSFSLDDIILLRDPSALMKTTYEYGVETDVSDETKWFEQYVSDFAFKLKHFAYDVLLGNFEIFKDLDKIVKERAKRYKSG